MQWHPPNTYPIRKQAMHNAHHYLKTAYHGTANTEYTLPTDWGQGRASFGGLIAGMMIAAMRRNVPAERALLSMSCTFAGPVLLDAPFTINTCILRDGKNAMQLEARIVQDDGKGNLNPTIVLASFGAMRPSKAVLNALPAPSVASPEALPALPFIPNVIPNFAQHVDMRWAFGALPYSGQGTHEMGGWWRWKDCVSEEIEPELFEAHRVALTDAWPPAILPLINKLAPASSMTWTMQFAQPAPAFDNAWHLYRATIAQAAHGYGLTHAEIWDAQGQLIAVSSQLVAVFDGE